MAVRLVNGGNECITIGGQFNPQFADPNEFIWSNPTSGLTALTFAVSLKPDSPFGPTDSGAKGAIFHQGDNAFYLDQPNAPTDGQLRLQIFDQEPGLGQQNRLSVRTTSTTALVPGVWNRIMVRWRVAAIGVNEVKIDVNGVPMALNAFAGETFTQITRLSPTPAYNAWAIEVGAESAADVLPVRGDYAEAAIWGAFLPDSDAVKYGQGYSPNLLTATARIRYCRLTDTGTAWIAPGPQSGGGVCGSAFDEWNSQTYGPGQAVPFGGIFGATFATAPHPLVLYAEPAGSYVPHLLEDAPSLPTIGFERYELEGETGKRSGTVIQVPATNIYTALANAQYGDDIILNHLIPTGALFDLPTGKTVNASTPRMPPTMQRGLITMSQLVTMS